MFEKVGKLFSNYIGEFIEYDKNNGSRLWKKYMRLGLKIDLLRPLKFGHKINN